MNPLLTILITVLCFIAAIGPLIFVHELGHYLAGRAFGVQADMFSIGMGRELFGWTDKRGTRWKVSALPIGGYVKFAGDMGPASTPDPAWLAQPPEQRARTLQGRPVWQRFLVVLAGPATNFVAAIAIFTLYFAITGVPQTPATISQVAPGTAAAAAGLRPGDHVVSVAGRSVANFEDMAQMIMLRPGQRLILGIERGGAYRAVPVTPQRKHVSDGAGNESEIGLLGVASGRSVQTRVGPIATVAASFRETGHILQTMMDVIGQIVGGERSAKELGGPLKIAQFSGQVATFGWLPFIRFMAFISINLGFINLLPIPLLDGGHLFFYIIEGVRRRPLPAQTQEWAFRSGLALLLGFMLFVTVNDLASFGLWRRLAGLIG
ncbi:RIP metalloprotease RseP [Sphingomonas crusticola]|uniref:RIP metalloprotease RseP n=1 Tax=Sphingomonas crusticola TaxID=1697973 RepID=UPI000E284990|nr:RIP metalloprotease RseP [Sphingomonas crusticola]